jgi:YVTN family beta-propeller protein
MKSAFPLFASSMFTLREQFIKNTKNTLDKNQHYSKINITFATLAIIFVCSIGSGSVSYADSLVTSIPVGVNPYGVGYDSANGNIYVANFGDNSVSVINGATNAIVNTIPVGVNPAGVTYDSANGNIYVTAYSGNSVSVIATLAAPTSPDAPTGLGAIPISTSQIDLSWTAPANNGGSPITEYRIDRSTGNGTFATIAITPTTTFSDTGLAAATLYSYQVHAINTVDAGPASNTATAITIPLPTVQVVPVIPPVLTVPVDMTVFAKGPLGAVVTFTVTVTNLGDTASTPTCNPSSGSTFPIGTTTVVCTSTNTHGSIGTASFHVTVLGYDHDDGRAGKHSTIAITFPPNHAVVSTTTLSASGTATSPIGYSIQNVNVSIDGDTFSQASKTGTNFSTWSFSAHKLCNGVHTIDAQLTLSSGTIVKMQHHGYTIFETSVVGNSVCTSGDDHINDHHNQDDHVNHDNHN